MAWYRTFVDINELITGTCVYSVWYISNFQLSNLLSQTCSYNIYIFLGLLTCHACGYNIYFVEAKDIEYNIIDQIDQEVYKEFIKDC